MAVNLKKATTQTQEIKKVMSVFLTNLAQQRKSGWYVDLTSDHNSNY